MNYLAYLREELNKAQVEEVEELTEVGILKLEEGNIAVNNLLD